ncbi:MAG: hypothetical protein K2R98_12730, partial [Gemmataceae bacterium]|nr:hypothetical protein [Gemmataceae bacterium]
MIADYLGLKDFCGFRGYLRRLRDALGRAGTRVARRLGCDGPAPSKRRASDLAAQLELRLMEERSSFNDMSLGALTMAAAGGSALALLVHQATRAPDAPSRGVTPTDYGPETTAFHTTTTTWTGVDAPNAVAAAHASDFYGSTPSWDLGSTIIPPAREASDDPLDHFFADQGRGKSGGGGAGAGDGGGGGGGGGGDSAQAPQTSGAEPITPSAGPSIDHSSLDPYVMNAPVANAPAPAVSTPVDNMQAPSQTPAAAASAPIAALPPALMTQMPFAGTGGT